MIWGSDVGLLKPVLMSVRGLCSHVSLCSTIKPLHCFSTDQAVYSQLVSTSNVPEVQHAHACTASSIHILTLDAQIHQHVCSLTQTHWYVPTLFKSTRDKRLFHVMVYVGTAVMFFCCCVNVVGVDSLMGSEVWMEQKSEF